MARYQHIGVGVIGLLAGALGLSGCDVSRSGGGVALNRRDSGLRTVAVKPADSGGAVDISVAEATEVDLVEKLVRHRADYYETLRRLHEYYQSHGYDAKAQWARAELRGFGEIRKFRYLLDAEVAAEDLRPSEQIPEADALFEMGKDLMRRGGHGIPAVYRRDRMLEAAQTFRTLIQQYPTSDKIDDAAFMLGEIHKEYFEGQELIAVKWYERAWTWDPDTPHPARFQAATVYDYRLHDRDRALELYRAAIEHDPEDSGNLRFAQRRIDQLTAAPSRAHASP